MERGGEEAFPGRGRLTPEEERIRKLERKIEILQQERDIPKTSSGHLLETKQVRFQFIEDHRDEFPVSRMCEMLDVSRSGYYAWRGRPPSNREMANQGLYTKIKAVYHKSEGTYGSPRIYSVLEQQGSRAARMERHVRCGFVAW